MIFRDNRVFIQITHFLVNHDCYACWYLCISNYFCSNNVRLFSYSNVHVFIELYVLRNLCEKSARESACMFFRSAKNVFISPRYERFSNDCAFTITHARGQLNRRITKLHAMSMRPWYWRLYDRAHCNRGWEPNRRIAVFLNARLMIELEK